MLPDLLTLDDGQDALDKLLELGSIPDYISPALAFAQDAINGPGHTFMIHHDVYGEWCGAAIEWLLHRNGIQTWGGMIVDNVILITVRKEQAHWAEYVLLKSGVPLIVGETDG